LPRVDVSVIVVNYNTAHLLVEMRDALHASATGMSIETIVVDNASRDDSAAVLAREFAHAKRIDNQVNVGFGRANNQGAALATGRHVLLLNTDAFVAPDTLRKTVEYMDLHPECGILGVRLVGRDGVLQPCCRYFPTPWNTFLKRTGWSRYFPGTRMVDDLEWDHASVRECDWVVGCYFLIRQEVVQQTGLFDPRYFLYSEEVDLCRTAKNAGWKVVFFPGTTVVHIGGESAKTDSTLTAGRQISDLQIESELLYFRKQHRLAGVVLALALSTLADLLDVCKSTVKRRWPRVSSAWKHLKLYWALSLKTGLGARPTR
jgi:hypothetical protein